MSSSPAQREWAERIRQQVNAEFDRVAAAFRRVAEKQDIPRRAHTESVIAILENIRTETMSREDAGYFITEWQEIHDQVRRSIAKHPAFLALNARRNRST